MKQYQLNWAYESAHFSQSLSDRERVERLKQDQALQARINNPKILGNGGNNQPARSGVRN